MGDARLCERETVTLKCALEGFVDPGSIGIDVSVQDPATGLWLNFDDGTWQATEDKRAMGAGVKVWDREIAADLSNVPVTSHRLFAYFEKNPAQDGYVDIDELIMGSTIHNIANKDVETVAAAIAGEVTQVLADTTEGGGGPWTTGAGGDPAVYAAAVWGAIKSAFNDPDTMGEIMNQLSVANLDTTTVIEAINAATSLLLSATDKEGACPPSGGMILGRVYTGHKGDQLICAVYRNGSLMTGPEFEGATQLSIEINNITDGTQLDLTDGVNKGPEGYFVYTTRDGDGAFETAGKWEYQVSGLDGLGAPFQSQRLTVRVYDDVE